MGNASADSNRWLYGPVPDLLLGCGLGYGLVFLVLAFVGSSVMSVFPMATLPLIALFLSIPHYGATLLRVYEKPEDRKKYEIFSFHLSAIVWLWFIAGVYDNYIGSMLITLYILWSPWHYMGQNYGLSLMFLARRGIQIPKTTKRLLHCSFLFSYLLILAETLTLIHGLPDGELTAYHILVPNISVIGRDAVSVFFCIAYVGTTGWVVRSMLRHGNLSDLAPTFLLMFTQALWFLVPLLTIRFQLWQGVVPLSKVHASYAFFWVAIGHAVQYLWITSYFAKQGNREKCSAFLGKALICGAIIWVVPAVIFSPALLGTNSYNTGLALLVAAAVNVHHFVLDSAIWKLRDGRTARILIHNITRESLIFKGAATKVRYAIGVLGMACVFIYYMGTVTNLAYSRAWNESNIPKMETYSSRLQWLGRGEQLHQEQIGLLKTLKFSLATSE